MTAGRGISHSEVSPPSTTLPARCPAVGGPAGGRPAHRPGLRALRAGPGHRGRLDGAGLPRFAARRPRRWRRTRRCWARRSCSSRHPTLDLDVDPAYEHGVLVDTGVATVAQHEVEAERARLRRRPGPPPWPLAAHDQPVRLLLLGGRAVRRVDRHVVELRRPQPRGDRGLPRGVAGADHADGRSSRTARTWPTGGSGSCSTTTSRRSPPPRCRPSASRNAASADRWLRRLRSNRLEPGTGAGP